jgi:hypothetical protein
MRTLNKRLAVIAMLTSTVLTISGVSSAAPEVHQTTLTNGTIVHGHFVRGFSLAGGALTLAPFTGVAPTLTSKQVDALWATTPLAGAVQGLGLAWVSVDASKTQNTGSPRATTFDHVLAWVGLTRSYSSVSFSCPVELSGGPQPVTPVSSGWQAVIMPINPAKSIAVFTARRLFCDRIAPSTIQTGYEELSVVWRLVRGNAVLSIPVCGREEGYGGAGNERTGVGSFSGYSLVLERPLGWHCAPATTFDAGTADLWPTTTHGPTGPVRQVSPGAQ